MRKGLFTFDKGKSCLFTTHFVKRRNMKIQIEVMDGMIFPSPILASSEVLEKEFDPESLHIQTLLKKKVDLFDDEQTKFGVLSLIITLQVIGRLSSSKLSSDEDVFPQVTRQEITSLSNFKFGEAENQSAYGFNKEDSHTVEMLSPSTSNTPSEGESKHRCCSTKTQRHYLSDSNNNSSNSKKKDKLLNLKLNTNSVERNGRNLKSKAKIPVEDRPKGWLRSTPVYKGNISNPLFQSRNTRTTFFRLYKTYPDIERHLKNEVERQIKEKVENLDKKFQEEIKKQKLKYCRRGFPSAKPELSISSENKINVGLQTQNVERNCENKETLVGKSLLEQLSTSFSTPPSEDCNDEIEERIPESAHSTEVSYQTKSSENYTKNNKQLFEIKSSKVIGGNIRKSNLNDKENIVNLTKQNGIKYNLTNKDNSRSETTTSIDENLRETSKTTENSSNSEASEAILMEDQLSILQHKIKEDKSHQSDENLKEQLELEDKTFSESDYNHQNISGTNKTPANILIHQSSKTSSSIYPQSSEDKLRGGPLSPVPQSSRQTDDEENTVSDISEEIAKLLIPRKEDFHSIKTDSISSFIPSNLSGAYSSLSDLDIS